MVEIIDLTFIEDERRRVDVAQDIAIVYDGMTNNGVPWRIDHLCETIPDPERGQVRKRVAPYLSPAHVIESERPLTISPSILCKSCGLHGWVKDDRWVNAG